jgi:hypothetical protein
MSHRFRSIISALAVLVYATVGVVAVHAETLCVGSDGHIAFEGPAGGDDCHGATVEDPSCDAMSAPSGVDAVCCTDFALPGRTALKAKDSPAFVADQVVLVAWFLAEIIPSDGWGFPARAPAFDERATSSRTRTSHQTAVLLI